MALAPVSDISITGWLAEPSGAARYATIDESAASDEDYIYTPRAGAQKASFGLPTDVPAGTHVISVRCLVTSGAASARINLLDSSDAVVGSSAVIDLTNGWATYVVNVTTSATARRVEFAPQSSAVAGALTLGGAVLTLNGESLGLT